MCYRQLSTTSSTLKKNVVLTLQMSVLCFHFILCVASGSVRTSLKIEIIAAISEIFHFSFITCHFYVPRCRLSQEYFMKKSAKCSLIQNKMKEMPAISVELFILTSIILSFFNDTFFRLLVIPISSYSCKHFIKHAREYKTISSACAILA